MNQCKHRWLCGTPVAGITKGTCVWCGKKGTFADPDMTTAPGKAWVNQARAAKATKLARLQAQKAEA